MIVVYPFSPVDQELALKNAKWIRDLGGCKAHECLMVADKRCSNIQQVQDVLIEAFDKVYPLIAGAEIDGWPEGANYFFRTATAKLQGKPSTPYFMWMEPDAIPLESHWLDKLEAEYKHSEKPFMGDRVQVENIPVHMSGVGIYPNPLHQYAGEAYRAYDVAWDMAGAGQIVPQAHFTDLIEHAWKHPSFKSHAELATQIAKPTILFHASKDGSLIDLLRTASGETGKETTTPTASMHRLSPSKEREEPRSPSLNSFQNALIEPPSITCDIFIRTYPNDYEWLYWCLVSIQKFCTEFRRVVVCSPSGPPDYWVGWKERYKNADSWEWKITQDETTDGYLAQQITKMYADVLLDYQPDFVLHIDSDTVFTRNVTPKDFFYQGKPFWFYTPYAAIETPWEPITEKFMGLEVPYEFMRRFPIMVPRWLYPRIREFCYKTHGMIVSDYIRNQPHRALSEFNIMGAYAYRFHRDKFAWVDTLGDEYPLIPPCARQFRSWEGITIEIRETLNAIVREVDESPTPTAGAVPPLGGAALPPAGIEELPNGIWVIKGDTHVSQWVKIQQRLDHDQNSLPDILPLIKPGDVVIDAGAFIGDHTIAYSKAVGDKGKVYAFEPNPLAVECAVHNLRGHDNVLIVEKALGDKRGWSPLSGNNGNAAGAYLGDHQAIKEVQIECLDHYNIPKVDFIKWDIEGCEVKALIGAEQTIRRCHPIMVMEVNVTALSRQGATVGQLFALLESHGYSWKVMQENASEFDLMYDIICTPQKSPGVSSQGNGEKEDYRCSSSPPPVSSPATDVNFLEVDPMKTAVGLLQNFAMLGPKNKARVMLALYHAGLTTKKTKKKKQHENKRAVPDQKDEASMEATTTTPKSRKSKRAGRNRSRRLVSATEKE